MFESTPVPMALLYQWHYSTVMFNFVECIKHKPNLIVLLPPAYLPFFSSL